MGTSVSGHGHVCEQGHGTCMRMSMGMSKGAGVRMTASTEHDGTGPGGGTPAPAQKWAWQGKRHERLREREHENLHKHANAKEWARATAGHGLNNQPGGGVPGVVHRICTLVGAHGRYATIPRLLQQWQWEPALPVMCLLNQTPAHPSVVSAGPSSLSRPRSPGAAIRIPSPDEPFSPPAASAPVSAVPPPRATAPSAPASPHAQETLAAAITA
eukprot:360003-Chlamydomonas_euryale.AAC.9